MITLWVFFSIFQTVRSGTNDFCPCLTQACTKFSDIPDYPFSPSWSFLFEDNPLYNSGVEYSIWLNYNPYMKIVKVPERNGSVLFCNKPSASCISFSTIDLPDFLCVKGTGICANGGFTFSLWVKIGVNEKSRLDKSKSVNTTNFVNFPGQGMSIKYNHYQEKWQVEAKYLKNTSLIEFSGNNAERWHQIAGVTIPGIQLWAYFDGKLMDSQIMMTTSQTNWGQVAPTFLDGGENPTYGRFWVDDFKMWTTPLTAAQIEANYIDELKD